MKHLFLQNLSRFILRYPKPIVVFSLATALLSTVVSINRLTIDADQDNLISESLPYHKRYRDFLREFGDLEYFFVVFEVAPGNGDESKKALLSLVQKIRPRVDLFRELIYREDYSVFKDRAFLLLPDKDFETVTANLHQWSRQISRLISTRDYADLFRFMSELLKTPFGTIRENQQPMEAGLELFDTLLDGLNEPKVVDTLSLDTLFETISGKTFYQDPEGFFFSESGRLLFLKVMPVKDFSTMKVVENPITFLRQKIDEVRAEFPTVTMGVTGRPALQYDEMTSTGSDSIWASLFSILGVALLYIFFLRRLRRPLLIILCLVCGIAWSAAFITLTLGHLNLLTVVFAIILVGLGVDYGMHFLLRYLKELQDGLDRPQAIEKTLTTLGSGIVTGAIASIISFYSALLTDFRGLQELGFVAGSGLLFCVIAMMVTFPAALLLWDNLTGDSSLVTRRSSPVAGCWLLVAGKLLATSDERLATASTGQWPAILRHPSTTLTILIVLTILSLPFVFRVRFENNLLKLQDPNLESVRYETKIMEDTGISTWFAAFLTPSHEKLEEMEKKVAGLDTVSTFESIRSFVRPDQKARIQILQDLKAKLHRELPIPAESVDLQRLRESLEVLHQSLGALQEKAFSAGETEGVEKMERSMERIGRVLSRIREDPAKTSAHLRDSQERFFRFFHPAIRTFQNLLSPSPLSESEIPPTVTRHYVGETGNHVLYVYPEEDIWHWDAMKRFMAALRKVDPQVTGSPVSVYESATRMQKGFYLILTLTALMLIVILWFDFRSPVLTAIAMAPLGVGIFWLLFWMGLLDIPFNLGNFFGLPVIAGIGIDSGIHLIHRYREKRDVGDMLKTVSPAIILSTVTTLIGFGSLAFVRHRGLASFGQLMSLGSLTTLAAALVIVPLLLKVIYGKKE